MELSKEEKLALIAPRAVSVANLKGLVFDTLPYIVTFLAIDVALGILFFGLSSPSSHVGTLRPVASIAPKLFELMSIGLLVGLVSCIASRSFDLSLMTLGTAFVMLLDFDHMPSVLGVPQPIRPDHSLSFLLIVVLALYVLASRKGRIEVPVLMVSAFFAHLAGDSGLFALFAPFSFSYASLNEFKIPFALCAIVFAILAGNLKSRKMKKSLAVSKMVAVGGVI